MPTWIYLVLLAAVGIAYIRLHQRRRAEAVATLLANSFIVKPYLQLGNTPKQSAMESVEVHWISDRNLSGWKLEYRALGGSWLSAGDVRSRPAGLLRDKSGNHLQAVISNLPAGSQFEYRVLVGKTVVFTAVGKCRMPAGKPFRFVVYGDLANGSNASRYIATAVARVSPDLVALAGDLVYKLGLMREYLAQYFPVLNADSSDPAVGGSIMRSVLVVAAPGNHDQGMKEVGDVGDFRETSDLGAFYTLWSQPLNGPTSREWTENIPPFLGGADLMRPMLDGAGERFPRMSNFSFDFGDSHWLMLDANWYMDWSNPALRAWVDQDLGGSDKRWKFVVLHQPPFTTDVKHADEQRMRLLAGIFEKHGVDVVFGGHNHTYERNHPLRFKVTPRADGKPTDSRGRVEGTFEFDRQWNGKTVTKLNGVMYIVTGGGGAKMYVDSSRRADRNNLPAWTAKLVDDVHSFTVCDLTYDRLTFRQLDAGGKELDRFEITK